MKLSTTLLRRLWLSVAVGAAACCGLKADDGVADGPEDAVTVDGIVSVSVASLRAEPSHTSSLETQAVMGTPVKLHKSGRSTPDWIECTTPDGYRAFIHRTAFVTADSARMSRWRSAPRLIIRSVDRPKVMADTIDPNAEPITDLVNGAIVEGVKSEGRFSRVVLPDGYRQGYIATSDAAVFEPSEEPVDVDRLIYVASSMMGTPYLWGGTSTLGVDCSGLTRVAFWDQGILLPRNASQQATVGKMVKPDADSLRRGDLLFFAADSVSDRITHVGIYEGCGSVIHSSGTVHRSRLFTDTAEMLPQRLRSARRIERLSDFSEGFYFNIADSICTQSSDCHGTSPVWPPAVQQCDKRFRPQSLIAPAAMVAIGVWGVNHDGCLWRVNKWTDRKLGRRSMHGIDDVMQFVPDVMMVCPDGWLGHSRYTWRERAAMTVTGELIVELIVQPLKRLVHCQRPDATDSRSFPSGHTARAFMGAELLRISYGGLTAAAGYVAAAATGVMRIASGRHWLTDVVGGAGVGILSAQLARLMLPAERRLLAGTGCRLTTAVGYDAFSRGAVMACRVEL